MILEVLLAAVSAGVLESAAQDRAAVNVMRKRCEKTIAELRAELKRVTAERDAAKRDIEKAMELTERELPGILCEFCKKNDACIRCDGPEWRGPVAENATAESEV